MSLRLLLSTVAQHPLNQVSKSGALARLFRWQLATRLFPHSVAVPFVDQTRLLVSRGTTGATANVYCGLHEFDDMGFVLHVLRPDDLFIDIGSNVGSYSVLAGGAAGANVYACEPVPSTFEHLLDNVYLNRLTDLVSAHNLAIGAKAGTLSFTAGEDTMNHALPAGAAVIGKTIDVPVKPLDEALEAATPFMLKIDVEGFETAVFDGAWATVANPGLTAMLVELNGFGPRYGYDEGKLHQRILSAGFKPCVYDPFARKLTERGTSRDEHGNTLYVRDLAGCQQRVSAAKKFRVLGQSV